MQNIYLAKPGGQKEGPYTLEQINRDLATKKYSDADFWAWHEGLPSWLPLYSLPGVSAKPQPSAVPEAKPRPPVVEAKSKPVAPEAKPEPAVLKAEIGTIAPKINLETPTPEPKLEPSASDAEPEPTPPVVKAQ